MKLKRRLAYKFEPALLFINIVPYSTPSSLFFLLPLSCFVVMPSRKLQQDKDVALPVSNPLTSMDQLKKWDANQVVDVANVASVKLHARPEARSAQGPRLLLCHDMAGRLSGFFMIILLTLSL